MGLSYLLGLCLAVFSVATLAANPPVAPTNPVGYTRVTTPYTSTTSPPQISHVPPRGVPNVGGGSSYPVPPTRPITPIVSNGGFNAPARGGVTIEGIKSPPIPTSGTANYPKPTVNNAAKSLLRNNLAGLALGAGLQMLLDGIGALIDEAGTVNRVEDEPPLDPICPPNTACWTRVGSNDYVYSSPEAACIAHTPYPSVPFFKLSGSGGTRGCVYSDGNLDQYLGETRMNQSQSCPPNQVYTDLGCRDYSLSPFPPDQLDDAVDNSYNPDPSDFDNLTPYMFPQSYTQNPIPTVFLPTVTTTQSNTAGDTTTTNTTTKIDFTVDNSKPIPEVETKVTDDTESFTNGQPSGSSSTSTTNRPNDNPKAPPDTSTGGGSAQFPEIPTDCDFMPTVCAFLDWFKDSDLDEDPDLTQIMKEDAEFEQTRTISFGSKQCPPPYTMAITSLGMSAELKFDFFCQFAEYAKFLVMAASYIFAIYISLGVSRNG